MVVCWDLRPFDCRKLYETFRMPKLIQKSDTILERKIQLYLKCIDLPKCRADLPNYAAGTRHGVRALARVCSRRGPYRKIPAHATTTRLFIFDLFICLYLICLYFDLFIFDLFIKGTDLLTWTGRCRLELRFRSTVLRLKRSGDIEDGCKGSPA